MSEDREKLARYLWQRRFGDMRGFTEPGTNWAWADADDLLRNGDTLIASGLVVPRADHDALKADLAKSRASTEAMTAHSAKLRAECDALRADHEAAVEKARAEALAPVLALCDKAEQRGGGEVWLVHPADIRAAAGGAT